MNKEKQIEEMDDILREIFGCQFAYKLDFAKYGGYLGHKEVYTKDIAKEFISAGYRKTSEVAREVIEEVIEIAKYSADAAKVRADNETNVLLRCELRGQQIEANLIYMHLAKLKKKYTEGEG